MTMRTRTRMKRIAVAILLVGGVAACQPSPNSASPTLPPVPTPSVAPATVVDVVDGDTIDVRMDGDIETVRLVGIDTPERGECGYDKATLNLGRMLNVAVTLVEAGPETDDRDLYGRLLRYVEAGGDDVGLQQIEDGMAIARYDSRDGYGRHDREAEYIAADAASKKSYRCGSRNALELPPLPGESGRCDRRSYPDVCIPPYPPDLNCDDISASYFRVRGDDPHGFDSASDPDRIGCEG